MRLNAIDKAIKRVRFNRCTAKSFIHDQAGKTNREIGSVSRVHRS